MRWYRNVLQGPNMSELLGLRNDILSLSPAQVRELFNFLGEILAIHFMPQKML